MYRLNNQPQQQLQPIMDVGSKSSSSNALQILQSDTLLHDLYHFIVWRFIASAYCISILVASIIIEGDLTYFYYLTNWSLLLSVIYLSLSAVMTIQSAFYKAEANEIKLETNIFIRLVETCQHICCSVSIVVVISYWVFVGNPENPILSIHKHGISSLITTIDVLLCSNVISFKETFYKPFLFSIIFIIWSLFAAIAFELTLYDALDWIKEPATALVNIVINVIVLTVVHALVCYGKNYCRSKDIEVKKHHESEVVTEDCDLNCERDDLLKTHNKM